MNTEAQNLAINKDALQPNDCGVYTKYETEVIARHNRSVAEVSIARCTDGLFRYAVSVQYSYGGFSGPITDDHDGFEEYDKARDAGIRELLKRFPKGWASDPHSVHVELEIMRKQVEQRIRQPTLF